MKRWQDACARDERDGITMGLPVGGGCKYSKFSRTITIRSKINPNEAVVATLLLANRSINTCYNLAAASIGVRRRALAWYVNSDVPISLIEIPRAAPTLPP